MNKNANASAKGKNVSREREREREGEKIPFRFLSLRKNDKCSSLSELLVVNSSRVQAGVMLHSDSDDVLSIRDDESPGGAAVASEAPPGSSWLVMFPAERPPRAGRGGRGGGARDRGTPEQKRGNADDH